MWIPRPIYEAIPYVCGGLGAALIGAAFLMPRAPQGALFALGGLAVTAGLVLWMKRRDYRSTQSDYDPHSLDE